MSLPAQQTSGGLGALEGLYEPLNGLSSPLPSPPPPPTPSNSNTAVPAWLKPAGQILPSIVQNTTPPKTSPQPSPIQSLPTTLPGVYYPQPAAPIQPSFGPQLRVQPSPPPAAIPLSPLPVTPSYSPPPPTSPQPPQPAAPPPPTPPSEPILKPQPTPTIALGGEVSTSNSMNEFMVPVLASFFALGALFYGGLTGLYLYIGYQFSRVLAENHGVPFPFIQEQPLLAAIPIVLVLAGLLFAWAGLWVKQGRQSGWWWGVSVGIAVPIILTVISYGVWSQSGPLITLAVTRLSLSNIAALTNQASIWFFGLPLIVGISTLFCHRSFNEKPLTSTSSSTLFFGITLIPVLLVGISVGFACYQAFNEDYGINQVSEAVNYHVYKPRQLPGTRVYKSKYFVNQGEGMLNGRSDFIQVTFDRPLAHTKDTSPIILRQVDIKPGFDIDTFAASLLSGLASPSAVVVNSAANGTGYALEVFGSHGVLRAVTFTTSQNVLIFISSTKAPVADLITLANALI